MRKTNLPQFTATHSVYDRAGQFQARSGTYFGSESANGRIYPQKPNSENTPGGKCHASTTAGSGGTINSGTYDADGKCCGPKLSNGSQYCINCDGALATCGDGHKARIAGLRAIGNLQSSNLVQF